MSIEFIHWPKTPRLFRNCVITEKLDGTNAQIIIQDGKAYAGSRSRLITIHQDNFGFARWVHDNHDELVQELGEGRHYGEWWGHEIQRGYGLTEKRFSLFNTHRWKDVELKLCSVVPILSEGPFSETTIHTTLTSLEFEGSKAAPGFMKPEGIIVYHEAAQHSFKVLLENDDKPKGI